MEIPEGVYLIPDLLNAEECQEYIDLTEGLGYEAAPITTASGFVMRPDIRNNTRVILDDLDRAEGLWRRSRGDLPVFVRGRQAIGLNERFRF